MVPSDFWNRKYQLTKKKIDDITKYIESSNPGEWLLDTRNDDKFYRNIALVLIKRQTIEILKKE